MQKKIERRSFLKKTLGTCAVAATFSISGTSASGRILGANDRIRAGVVGINGRGRSHIEEFGKMDNVDVAALIDVDTRVLDRRVKETSDQFKTTVQGFQDLRQALDEMKDLDVISIATCNHTHALLALWAVQAGKDVYVEKPCEHNLFEGRKLVEATQKYARIVQHGTQSRSSSNRAELTAAAKSGKYGKLKLAKGYCCKPRWSIGFRPNEEPPKTLDFNLWLGPAPQQPYHKNLVHYNWHWFWDTGNGDIGNQGVHEMDLCRWGLGVGLPKKIISFGARYVDEPDSGFKDQGQTPNMQLALYEYDDCSLLFETRGLVGDKAGSGQNWQPIVDVEFYTTEGMLKGDRFYPNQGEVVRIEGIDFDPPRPGGHFGNFIDAVRERDRRILNADISVGHLSAALCQFGNISHLLGATATPESIRSAFGNDEIVQKGVETVFANLRDALPDLKNPEWTLGQKLDFDPKNEQFVNNPVADRYLTREYRAPFVVPNEV
ncbi:MAG: Gfo/Idh/MocA family protein [Thermoguttaceae bacterium]